jgi:hypothetical protein
MIDLLKEDIKKAETNIINDRVVNLIKDNTTLFKTLESVVLKKLNIIEGNKDSKEVIRN